MCGRNPWNADIFKIVLFPAEGLVNVLSIWFLNSFPFLQYIVNYSLCSLFSRPHLFYLEWILYLLILLVMKRLNWKNCY